MAKTRILINEHIAKDGPIVFAHDSVSKKIDGTYRSGPCRVSIKVRNPAQHRRPAGEGRDLESVSPRPQLFHLSKGVLPKRRPLTSKMRKAPVGASRLRSFWAAVVPTYSFAVHDEDWR
jgi:hypothetical protein